MEVYPRTKTWPYLVVVSLLFSLAAWQPDWWLIWPAESSARLPRLAEFRTIVRDSSMGARISQAAKYVEPVLVALKPPVGERIAVAPAPDFADETEPAATARFPEDKVVADPEDELLEGTEAHGPPVGPILPPGGPHALDFAPADIDGLTDSLNSDVTSLTLTLQSAADSTSEMPGVWPRPVALWILIGQLKTETKQLAVWNNELQDALTALQAAPSLDHPAVEERIEQLDDLAARASQLEVYLAEAHRPILRRIRYGIERRTQVWRAVHELAIEQDATPVIVNAADLVPSLEAVESRLSNHEYGDTWRNYLMLDQLRRIATESWGGVNPVRREVSQQVLSRMAAPCLTESQLRELTDPAIVQFRRRLEDWADASVDLQTLVTSLEQFEQIRSVDIANRVVECMNSLKYNRHPGAAKLRSAIDLHYRNANVRFSVSAQLLNDMLPILDPEDGLVRDQILGALVRGQNRTWTELHITLNEDPNLLRLRIHADGQTRSRTVSTQGPVRVYSRNQATFQANKELIVAPSGILTRRARGNADGNSTLLDLRTDYDQVPLLGWFVRQIALNEHQERRGAVRSEVDRLVAGRVSQRLDTDIHDRLTGLEEKVDQTFLEPLRDLELDPKTVELRTTPDRIVMRYRLAADDQLAAYTPRPRGRPGNYMSIQMHESLVNNLLGQLHLDDRRIQLEELMSELSEKLKIDRSDIHNHIPPGVIIHLGHDRPIEFEFDEDRVLVTIRIKELSTYRREFHNFVVRGRYRARVQPTHVHLERDGGIELVSEQLGFRDQITLRGIFTKVMTRNHRLNILRGRFLSDPRLNQLGVTQFACRDGWIGLSIGPLAAPTVQVAR